MKDSNPIISLKNFRSFKEEGSDFELAPITVLTGCNSSGKSSMAKALMLLKRLPKSRKHVLPALKLYSKDLGLGSFEKVINKQAENDEIVIAYRIWSNYLQEEVVVKRFFQAKSEDTLNDGYMCRYTIEKADGTIILEQDTSLDGLGSAESETHLFNIHLVINGEEFIGKKTNESTVLQNYRNFSLVSQYCHLVQSEYLFNCEQYKDCPKQLEEVKKEIRERGIDVEAYDIAQLEDWYQWLVRIKKLKEQKEQEYEEEIRYNREHPNEDSDAHLIKAAIEKFYSDNGMLKHYIDLFVDEVFSPWFTQHVEYVDSNSAAIRRSYSVEDTNKMSEALREYSTRKVFENEFADSGFSDPLEYQPGDFANRWLNVFMPENSFEFASDNEGGVKVYLRSDGGRQLLADEGYGITQLLSLLLLIDNAINLDVEEKVYWHDGKPDDSNLSLFMSKQVICVEEPEIHLHPKYQSLLADMFVEAYQEYNIHFVIETHSEYLIRKLQVLVADKENVLSPDDVSLNYVEKRDGLSTNRKIEIMEDGRLSDSFGTGFFDEADNRAMDLLHLKVARK